MCGEQGGFLHGGIIHPGSPPRVRGTASPDSPTDMDGRITPACAGNRESGIIMGDGDKDHPRVCGEQSDPLF